MEILLLLIMLINKYFINLTTRVEPVELDL